MRAILAGLAACILLATGGAALAAPSASTTIAEPVTEAERQEFRQAISGNPILVIVMKEFPGEYAAFETQLLADANAGRLTATQARDRTNVFITSIQRPVIGMVRFAPDEEIAELYRMNLATLRALAKVNLQACYLFGEGAGVTADIASSLPPAAFDAVAAYGAQELRAGIVGNKTRIDRRPLTEAEITPIVELFVSKEGDTAYLIAIADGQADTLLTEDRCRNAILWMEAVVEQPNATMGRLMATE
ncbi:MAG: hypothetical protein Q8L23_11895 [Caulobacter sp.]|nr:hypothetical protein [Caulobacter sp.]